MIVMTLKNILTPILYSRILVDQERGKYNWKKQATVTHKNHEVNLH